MKALVQQISDLEIQLEKLQKDQSKILAEKDSEICKLNEEKSNLTDQLQVMVDKHQNCKKELDNTQITCKKWAESSAGFELLLKQQMKSNIKFDIGFEPESNENNANDDAFTKEKMTEIIPTNLFGQEITITDKEGQKIVLNKPENSSSYQELVQHEFKPKWTENCTTSSDFKPIDFVSTEGKMAPKAIVIPLTDVSTEAPTSVKKKQKKKGKDHNPLV